jgi:hypothetical protein
MAPIPGLRCAASRLHTVVVVESKLKLVPFESDTNLSSSPTPVRLGAFSTRIGPMIPDRLTFMMLIIQIAGGSLQPDNTDITRMPIPVFKNA